MTTSERRLLLGNGLTLSCVEQGDAVGPSVLLIPGPTDSWRSCEPVLGHLPDGLHAVAISPRGHGDSDKPESGYGLGDLAADIPEVLDALGIEQAVLVGHSGSCLVAREVAVSHPERVSGLVLEASPTTLVGHAGLVSFVSSLVELDDPIDPAFARSMLVDTSSSAVPSALLEILEAELLKVPAAVWRQLFGALLDYDDRPRLAAVSAPVLLIWGDADALVTREMQHELLAALSRAELIVYEGVGHTPRWEDPSRFAADLARFANAQAATR